MRLRDLETLSTLDHDLVADDDLHAILADDDLAVTGPARQRHQILGAERRHENQMRKDREARLHLREDARV